MALELPVIPKDRPAGGSRLDSDGRRSLIPSQRVGRWRSCEDSVSGVCIPKITEALLSDMGEEPWTELQETIAVRLQCCRETVQLEATAL